MELVTGNEGQDTAPVSNKEYKVEKDVQNNSLESEKGKVAGHWQGLSQ
jgi:hypothetical protein